MFHGDDAEAFEKQRRRERDPHFYKYSDWKITENFCAPRILTNTLLVDAYDDWSRVRSPARAKRRMKRGFRQNIEVKYRPSSKVIHDRERNVMYCHPEVLQRIREHIDREMGRMTRRFKSLLFPVLPETVNPPADLTLKSLTEAMDRLAGASEGAASAFGRFSSRFNLDKCS